MPRKYVAIAGLLLCALAARGADSESEIALQRALDQPLTLTLDGVALSEAFKQIASAAKIPLQVDPACYELLPYGETTRVSVDFKQSRLRDSLDVLLMPLSLQTVIAGKVVMIQPSSALRHIGRRADWEELKLLKELWSSPDLKAPAGGPFSLVDAIRGAMEGRKDLIVQIPGEANGLLSQAQQQAMDQVGKQSMPVYRALDTYCQLTGNIWFVEAGPLQGGSTGGKIMIMTPKAWINRQLERPVQITSRVDQPLEAIVSDLANASGIRFVPEPGLYTSAPVVRLSSSNSSVRDTLDTLQSVTNIEYEVQDDSILLRMGAGPGQPNQPRVDNIIGKISVPIEGDPNGALMDIYIHESDLTPEQNAMRKKRLEQAVKALQKSWEPQPATAPAATQPATVPAATQARGE
jgi:hypothetical protein